MKSCKIFKSIFNFIPILNIKSWAIRQHLDRCPHCQQEIAGLEEIRPLYSYCQPEKIPSSSLWPRIYLKLKADKEEKREFISRKFFRRLRFAFLSGLALIVIISSFFIISKIEKKRVIEEASLPPDHLQIIRFEVKEKPASPVVYKPFGSNLIFIWAQSPEKNSPF